MDNTIKLINLIDTSMYIDVLGEMIELIKDDTKDIDFKHEDLYKYLILTNNDEVFDELIRRYERMDEKISRESLAEIIDKTITSMNKNGYIMHPEILNAIAKFKTTVSVSQKNNGYVLMMVSYAVGLSELEKEKDMITRLAVKTLKENKGLTGLVQCGILEIAVKTNNMDLVKGILDNYKLSREFSIEKMIELRDRIVGNMNPSFHMVDLINSYVRRNST